MSFAQKARVDWDFYSLKPSAAAGRLLLRQPHVNQMCTNRIEFAMGGASHMTIGTHKQNQTTIPAKL